MDVLIESGPGAVAGRAADLLEDLVRTRPAAVLGLAAGSTPRRTYRELIRRHVESGLSFGGVEAFLLDEYVGLPAGHPQAFRAAVARGFSDHVDLDPDRLHSLDGTADDLDAAAAAFEAELARAGPVDLQILGIGRDGHIGFNEPGSSLASRTRVKLLTEQTRRDNQRSFPAGEEVPRLALTAGVGTILEARHLVLLADGAAKAPAVAQAVEGPISAMVTASALQLHPHATVIVDEAAASELSRADYYRRAGRSDGCR